MNTYTFKSLQETVTQVLSNLKLIMDNKDFIIRHLEKSESVKINLDEEFSFDRYYGVCKNADLWALDVFHVGKIEEAYQPQMKNFADWIDNNAFIYDVYDVMDSLAFKFIEYHKGTDDITYPILDDGLYKSRDKWLNQQRWFYVEFYIAELEYFLEKGEFAIHKLEISEQPTPKEYQQNA